MNCSDFQKWLGGFLNFERTPVKDSLKLENIRFLCARLRHPEDAAPCIHIAGSKGKGSAAALCAGAIEQSGCTCGLYLSPHISDFRERITTPHGFFDDAVYESAADELCETVTGIAASDLPAGRAFTWFELVTVFAFLCFRRAHVDFAVYETGLGGRLDATNVVTPRVCVLMPIEREHTAFLGNTIEEIAREKAGIIKDGVPVVVARRMDARAKAVFAEYAARHRAPCIFADDAVSALRYRYTEGRMQLNFDCERFAPPHFSALLTLLGAEQAENAAAAALAVNIAMPDIPTSTIAEGIERIRLPARFEILPPPPKYASVNCIILDGAHTPKSVLYTVQTLREIFSRRSVPFHLLFGCAADKDMNGMAAAVRGVFSRIALTSAGSFKRTDLYAMQTAFTRAGIPFAAQESTSAAIKSALQNAHDARAILLAAGSFYLAAEVRAALKYACPPRTSG